MSRPKAGYYNAAGKRLPGVTTILSVLKDSGGLVHWAWQIGTEGRDYRAERDAAANSGTLAHDLVDAHVCKREPEAALFDGIDEDTIAKARKGFDAYREWESQVSLEVVATEQAIVSERYQFGGTFDIVGRVNTLDGPALAMVDLKTSNRLYPEYVAQIAAYTILWDEAGGDEITRWYLLRLDKDTASFAYHSYTLEVVNAGTSAFLAALAAYKAKRELERLVK